MLKILFMTLGMLGILALFFPEIGSFTKNMLVKAYNKLKALKKAKAES